MVVLTVVVNLAVFVPGLSETPVRVPLGLAFLLFVPGYVFIAALFPEAGESPRSDPDGTRSGIDGIERVALAFGLSIALTPLVGLALNFTPWGTRTRPDHGRPDSIRASPRPP
ncbi:MAG: DUF1616 domain-containing protein [Natrialbaceae archaeon]|nr:DUF1616 domain-containing protein [Natrialbaceae archaeon]